MIERLLICNRGEIAVRIVRAARELGIHSIVAHSEADADGLAVRLADQAICIGPAQASLSYLNVEAIIAAAARTQADAVHPGYGFLAESAELAAAVAEAGLCFIGPDAKTIARMGDKASARREASLAGVPIVPGSQPLDDDLDQAIRIAGEIGYPLLIKASAGGGGRGIRKVENAEELARQLPLARAEARAAFKDERVYLERAISHARHIEVQILADGERAVHLFERECSLQRRRQKILEEAPCAVLDEDSRQTLCASAVRLAEQIGYRGAGTLEYLFDQATGDFFFIEMNTRIQVEHPVTEMITGVDLVREMIEICAGRALGITQADIQRRGWAIEMRINAEDPDHGFFPSPGRVERLTWPAGPGIRIDSALYPGYRIPPFYDSLAAKLIVHAEHREAALARARRALDEFEIEGFATTAGLHRRLLDDPRVCEARFDTQYLEAWLAGTTHEETLA